MSAVPPGRALESPVVMSLRITCDSLHATIFSKRWAKYVRVALTGLERNREWEYVHLHGRLVIEIDGRVVPWLGHLGDDDVCFDAWVVELVKARDALGAPEGVYTYDEGEQGQPAFRFARRGDDVLLSIVDAAGGYGSGDPEWRDVPFPYDAFRAEVDRFVADLERETRAALPTKWAKWWPLREE